MSTILNISLKGPVAQDVADLRKHIDEFSKKKEEAEAPASPSKSGMALTINLSGGGGGSRKQRCGACAGCLGENCGQCRFCLNMKQYGGPGTLKQPCIQRRCLGYGVGLPPGKLAEIEAAAAANGSSTGVRKGGGKGRGGGDGSGRGGHRPFSPGSGHSGGGGSKGSVSSRKNQAGTYDPLLGPRVIDSHGVRYDPYDPWNDASASVLRRYEHLIGASAGAASYFSANDSGFLPPGGGAAGAGAAQGQHAHQQLLNQSALSSSSYYERMAVAEHSYASVVKAAVRKRREEATSYRRSAMAAARQKDLVRRSANENLFGPPKSNKRSARAGDDAASSHGEGASRGAVSSSSSSSYAHSGVATAEDVAEAEAAAAFVSTAPNGTTGGLLALPLASNAAWDVLSKGIDTLSGVNGGPSGPSGGGLTDLSAKIAAAVAGTLNADADSDEEDREMLDASSATWGIGKGSKQKGGWRPAHESDFFDFDNRECLRQKAAAKRKKLREKRRLANRAGGSGDIEDEDEDDDGMEPEFGDDERPIMEPSFRAIDLMPLPTWVRGVGPIGSNHMMPDEQESSSSSSSSAGSSSGSGSSSSNAGEGGGGRGGSHGGDAKDKAGGRAGKSQKSTYASRVKPGSKAYDNKFPAPLPYKNKDGNVCVLVHRHRMLGVQIRDVQEPAVLAKALASAKTHEEKKAAKVHHEAFRPLEAASWPDWVLYGQKHTGGFANGKGLEMERDGSLQQFVEETERTRSMYMRDEKEHADAKDGDVDDGQLPARDLDAAAAAAAVVALGGTSSSPSPQLARALEPEPMSALDRLKKRGRASFQDPQSPSSSDAANVLAQAARIASSGEDEGSNGDSASPAAKKARTVDDAT